MERLRYELSKMPYDYYKEAGIWYIKHDAHVTNPHWHDCYEMVLVISGKAVEHINECEFPVEEGYVALITPDDFHQLSNLDNYLVHHVMFPEEILNEDLLLKLITKGNDMNTIVKLDDEDFKSMQSLFDLLARELKASKNGYVNNVHSILNIMVSTVLRYSFTKSEKVSKYNSVGRAVEYIKCNFTKPLTLSEVAKEVNLEPNYFSSIFSKKLKTNFKNYLNEVRLNHALRELRSSDKTIVEICYSSGYGSISNFNRMFKKRYGITPKEYRASRISKN